MKLHVLKIKDEYFQEVRSGYKKAELRKNDRDFQEGDFIYFIGVDGEELQGHDKDGTPRKYNIYRITHVLKDVPEYGLKEGYAILSIERILY